MLNAVLAYINHHLEEDITLEQLAKFTGYSSFHLHRKLREEMKEPIGNFIKKQRIQKAGYLLSLTNLPVSDIRCLVGYDNDSAFSRAFRNTYHMSPTAYREAQLKGHTSGSFEPYISLKAEVVRWTEKKAIIFPGMGNYFSKDIYHIWSTVAAYIHDTGLRQEDFDYYTILHDCQKVNEEGLLRYDGAIVCKKDVRLPAGKYFSMAMPAAKFVKYKFCCPVAQYKSMAAHVNKHLLEESGLQHSSGASYFKFPQLPLHDVADHLLIEWLIPIK